MPKDYRSRGRSTHHSHHAPREESVVYPRKPGYKITPEYSTSAKVTRKA